jgi:hypothetical protein
MIKEIKEATNQRDVSFLLDVKTTGDVVYVAITAKSNVKDISFQTKTFTSTVPDLNLIKEIAEHMENCKKNINEVDGFLVATHSSSIIEEEPVKEEPNEHVHEEAAYDEEDSGSFEERSQEDDDEYELVI